MAARLNLAGIGGAAISGSTSMPARFKNSSCSSHRSGIPCIPTWIPTICPAMLRVLSLSPEWLTASLIARSKSRPATSAAYVPIANAISAVHPPPNDSTALGVGSSPEPASDNAARSASNHSSLDAARSTRAIASSTASSSGTW